MHPDIRNAIKVTHGNEVFVYKTEKGQEKQTMLVNVKRTTDEMLARSNESRSKGKCYTCDHPLQVVYSSCLY